MTDYIAKRRFKYNGKVYKPNDPIVLDGMWDDRLIGIYVIRVDGKKDDDVENAKRKRYAKQQNGLQPDKALDISTAAMKIINANGLDARKVAAQAGTNRITKPVVEQYIKEG